MTGKVNVKSYAAVLSKVVRRKCTGCKKVQTAQLVNYGKGGCLLFCVCGDVREMRKEISNGPSYGGRNNEWKCATCKDQQLVLTMLPNGRRIVIGCPKCSKPSPKKENRK